MYASDIRVVVPPCLVMEAWAWVVVLSRNEAYLYL